MYCAQSVCRPAPGASASPLDDSSAPHSSSQTTRVTNTNTEAMVILPAPGCASQAPTKANDGGNTRKTGKAGTGVGMGAVKIMSRCADPTPMAPPQLPQHSDTMIMPAGRPGVRAPRLSKLEQVRVPATRSSNCVFPNCIPAIDQTSLPERWPRAVGQDCGFVAGTLPLRSGIAGPALAMVAVVAGCIATSRVAAAPSPIGPSLPTPLSDHHSPLTAPIEANTALT